MAVETMVASIAIMNMAAMTEATTSGRRLVGAAGMSAKVGRPRPRGTASEGGSGRIRDHDLLQAEEGQPAAAPLARPLGRSWSRRTRMVPGIAPRSARISCAYSVLSAFAPEYPDNTRCCVFGQ